jgi:hypothetical protein
MATKKKAVKKALTPVKAYAKELDGLRKRIWADFDEICLATNTADELDGLRDEVNGENADSEFNNDIHDAQDRVKESMKNVRLFHGKAIKAVTLCEDIIATLNGFTKIEKEIVKRESPMKAAREKVLAVFKEYPNLSYAMRDHGDF